MLLKPSGIFKIDDSDKWCGSYISKQDLQQILKTDLFESFPEYVDEKDVHKNWNKLGSKGVKDSFDEYVLEYLIKKVYIV